jgi:hypothetical protein
MSHSRTQTNHLISKGEYRRINMINI